MFALILILILLIFSIVNLVLIEIIKNSISGQKPTISGQKPTISGQKPTINDNNQKSTSNNFLIIGEAISGICFIFICFVTFSKNLYPLIF